MKRRRKRTKILICLLLVLVLIISITASYAYFTATIVGNDTAKVSTVTSGNMGINYTDGDEVSAVDLLPGGSITKTFSVKNIGTVDTTYNINFSNLVNNFGDTSDLVYKIVSSDGGANVDEAEVPTESKKVSGDISIAPNVTHTYTLTISFLDTGDNQDDNQGKTFSTKITINEILNSLTYSDASGASVPELSTGMIPVIYNESGKPVVADLAKKWYDYDAHEWANAVLVNDDAYRSLSPGTVIPELNIVQYYVWIPRYRYLLWNADNGLSEPQMIDIKFEDKSTAKSTGSTNGTWLTHPAFTFGDEELNGIWVGKFEVTGFVSSVPGRVSNVSSPLSSSFENIRDIGLDDAAYYGLVPEEVDTHLMKNIDWGAVAYLTSSIYGRYVNSTTCIESGCKVWINNVKRNSSDNSTITGCAGASVNAGAISSTTCPEGYDWTTGGVNAATTGNQYGIYDMAGGAPEYVMGLVFDDYGNFNTQNSGFTEAPDAKYFDAYPVRFATYDYSDGKLGDATREVLKESESYSGGWYGEGSSFADVDYNWFTRGGSQSSGVEAGLFSYVSDNGTVSDMYAVRSVLVSLK